jgi:hypothetical protein
VAALGRWFLTTPCSLAKAVRDRLIVLRLRLY